uniref:Catalase domain-containing protein n=1 Tax=Trichuris muris TaxID=70415 RepID=A0A5S6QY79_TRIMR
MGWLVVDVDGTFEVTSDISHYTKARFLSEIGQTSAVQVRCTSKAGAGCPASATGFDVLFPVEKFVISAGSLPVTLRKDSSLKDDRTMMERSQDVEWFCRQVIARPESLHNFLLSFGPRRIPAARGLTNAYSARTFRLENSEGDTSYCRFHFTCLTNGKLSKAQSLHCDESPSAATFVVDLKEEIRNGRKMQFRVELQTLTEAEVEFLDWDPLDQTKVWLHSSCPLMPFGVLTLHSIASCDTRSYAEDGCAPGIEPILEPLRHSLPIGQIGQLNNPAWNSIIGSEASSLLPKEQPRPFEDPYWQPNLFWTSVLTDADRSRLAQRSCLGQPHANHHGIRRTRKHGFQLIGVGALANMDFLKTYCLKKQSFVKSPITLYVFCRGNGAG